MRYIEKSFCCARKTTIPFKAVFLNVGVWHDNSISKFIIFNYRVIYLLP